MSGGKAADLRLFPAGLRRINGVARDADDAILGAQAIKDFRRLGRTFTGTNSIDLSRSNCALQG
jgi:hypothetical protein